MKPPVLTLFNTKAGDGTTSLVYHLAWMFARLHKRVVVADLDPQANLTASFLDEETIEGLWNQHESGSTMYQCVVPLTRGHDILEPALQNITPDLHLVAGDVSLSRFEEVLSAEWLASLSDANLHLPMHILSSFWQVMHKAARKVHADIILVDTGPNLGALNRSVLVSTDYVALPLGADLFSLHGLKTIGPTIKDWTSQWQKRLENWNSSNEKGRDPELELPQGTMSPIGYMCHQPGVRLERPVSTYDTWAQRIPKVYRESVLSESPSGEIPQHDDPHCLATIRRYRSLIPMAQEHRKPIFDLTSADGAIGSYANAIQDARKDFKLLAEKIAAKIGVDVG